MKKCLQLLLVLLAAMQATAQTSNDFYLLIGTYTAGKSEGIYVYNFNTSNGSCSFVNKVKTSNPSFLAISNNGNYVYAVNEAADSTRFTKVGSVSSFSFNKKSGSMQETSIQSSTGKHPCHVTLDKTGKWLVAANYSDGSFCIMPIKADGTLDSASQRIQHEGKGKDEKRQAGPHAHQAVFSNDNKSLFIQDLGTDKVMLYNFNAETGKATPAEQPFYKAIDGAGPRHIEFHPTKRHAYLINELSNTIDVLVKDEHDKIVSIQNIPSVPKDYQGSSAGADIHVSKDGKFLYASNRGSSNTIGIFSIDDKTGMLKLVAHQSTMGKTPRNFSLDPTGNFLLVANQDSDNIIVFKRDAKTGLLSSTGYSINVGNPVCLKWISK